MIPQYRAKKIDVNDYCEGFYVETKYGHFLIETPYTDLPDTLWNDNFTEIDQTTLSINFPDMQDAQGTKIFASLSESGKGGTIFSNTEDCRDTFIVLFEDTLQIRAVHIDDFDYSQGESLYEWYSKDLKCYDLKIIGIQK